jgi:hypothetical protein
MITNEQIIELAKTCGFEEFIGERDDETDGVYYQFWEDQLLKFALQVADIEYDRGFDDGWESRADAERAKDRDT